MPGEAGSSTKSSKSRKWLWIAAILAVLVFAIYVIGKPEEPTPTGPADLSLATTSASIPAGVSGSVEVPIGNDGPGRFDDDVTFLVNSPPRLIISGRGRIDKRPFPDDRCVPQRAGHALSCRARLTIEPHRWLHWNIPVQIVGTPANTALRLAVTATPETTGAADRASNNTDIGFTVLSSGPPAGVPRSKVPPRPGSPGSTAAKRGGGLLSPVMLAVWILVGLGFLAVGVLAVVALVQRRVPMNYIPPRRDSSWHPPFIGKS